MARINSRSKGSKNERNLCKWWKEWTGYEFARVPSSGGLRWGRTTDTTGDIICTDKKHFLRFPFSIEAKDYKDINFEHLLLGNKKCKILEFWKQASDDAIRGNKIPVLMMRYNNMPKDEYFFVVEKIWLTKVFPKQLPNEVSTMGLHIFWENKTFELIVLKASDIITMDYRIIYKLAKKLLKSK